MKCPICESAGNIYQATLAPMNVVAFICDHCDATWESLDSIGGKKYELLSNKVRALGIPPDRVSLIEATLL